LSASSLFCGKMTHKSGVSICVSREMEPDLFAGRTDT
jgi:hypothetical protein